MAAANVNQLHYQLPNPASSSVSSRAILPWVQALRAVAAFSVAFVHLAHDAIANGRDPAGWLKAITRFLPWDAGVDIFFVISGLVIVHASAPLFATSGGPWIFVRRRLTRIVPLYWIMTAAFLAVLYTSRTVIHGDLGGPAFIIASFLFIPWPRPDGVMQPAFGLGWTLNYEIFFYAVFTPLVLLSRNKAMIAAALLLLLITAYGQWRGFHNSQLTYWSNPIILEFVAGMGLAWLLQRGVSLPFLLRLGCVAAALVALHVSVPLAQSWRPLSFGIPALMLVAAAALGGLPRHPSLWHRILVRLGDASYAMYLVHPFIMRGLTVSWHIIHGHSETSGTIYVLVGLAAAQACALLINICVERRFAIRLRRGVFPNEIV